MRPLLLVLSSLTLASCVSSLRSAPPPKWQTGFWFWDGSSIVMSPATPPLDVLFVQVGSIHKETRYPWRVWTNVFGDLPQAREYWLVFRCEQQQVPDLATAPLLADQFALAKERARQRHLKVAGLQLDIDSPTHSLSDYGKFLHEVRKNLPEDSKLSITALLDWFRPGTSIAEAIEETDEFVPQFYDAESSNSDRAIATKFDGAHWAPVFNRFRKPYRIGISTFGRAMSISKDGTSSPRPRYYGDLAPIDVAANPSFMLDSRHNQLNELVLTYRATKPVGIGYNKFAAGDGIQFILSTPESVHAAIEGARRTQGYCAGILFFRWPSSNETLAMQPMEALNAAGLASPPQQKRAEVHLVDGSCATVKCTDIYLINGSVLSPKPVRYVIRSSTELEYFLPEENVPVTMSGPSELTLSLPPFSGRARVYLGRAVSTAASEYKLEEPK